jgi:hypothetical protein
VGAVRLSLYGNPTSDWRTPLHDPNLTAVWGLRLNMSQHFDERETPVPPEVLRVWTASPLARRVPTVTWLTLDDSGLRALAEAGELALERLHMLNDPFDCDWADGAAAFASSPLTRTLRELDFGWCVTDDALVGLARGTELGRLELLSLNLGEVTGRGLRALAGAKFLTRLPDLTLHFSDRHPPTDDALRELVRIPEASPLRLSFSNLGREPPAVLRERFGDRVVRRSGGT